MAIAPIGPFVRFVVAGAAAAYANWDTISGLFERGSFHPEAPIFGQYVQNVIESQDYSATFSPKERGLFGVHFINTTGGDIDVTWTSGDYAAVEAGIQGAWSATANLIPSSWRLVEHRWYPFGPGVLPPNPPTRVTTLGAPIPGTAAGTNVHQLASTVTLRTPLRRHWGRLYVPIAPGNVTAGGQLTSGTVDSLSSAWATGLHAAASSQGIVPVVYDRQRHAALGVTAFEVDSVVDIIRRRRPRTTGYRKIISS